MQVNLKNISAITLSSAIVFSSVIPMNNAAAETASVTMTEQAISGKSVEVNVLDVDKENLIAKVNSLFPNQFNFVSKNDFHVSFNPNSLGDKTGAYSLDFFKEIGGGKQINGHFEFAGEDLALVSFYYEPADKKDALFPPKVTKEQAQTIAAKFLERLNLRDDYQLSEEEINYFSEINRPLTEPVMYQFTYDKLENGIPVQFQNVNITVLGNGEVTQLYNGKISGNALFESKDNIISKTDALQLLNDYLQINLGYLIDYDYLNDTTAVKLSYFPEPAIVGIHAKTKEFKIGDKFYKDLPQKNPITMLASTTSQLPDQPLTKEKAKQLAEKLLKPKDENVKLAIEGIEENDRSGTKIYSVQYMYYRGSSGSGSLLDINKETGEVLNFHSENRGFYFPYQLDSKEIQRNISEDEALTKALGYVKQYASANMNQYAYPSGAADIGYRIEGNEYYFHFPRVKDGIIVNGNGIDVSVSAKDGELYSLDINYTKVDKWPDLNKAIEKQKALEAIKGNIDVKLVYAANAPNEPYSLIYAVDQKNLLSYFDAITGNWQKFSYAGDSLTKETQRIEHPWAAEELNFLLQANILKVDDLASFNPDRPVTKGEALEILYKSLASYYDYSGLREEVQQPQQTFDNINPDHPLYALIERAVDQKIIDSSTKTFNLEEKLTKEELAFWYARALGLQLVADQEEIYKMNFADTVEMNKKYLGHIALVNGLGILTKNSNQQFQPKKEVTLAELAVSNVRLAKVAAEMNVNFR